MITSSLDKHAPVKTKTILKGKIDEPWISQSLKRSITKQQTLYRKTLKPSCKDTDRTKYLNYRQILTKLKRSCKKNYYSQKCLDFKSDSKKLWRLINKAMKKNSDKTSIIDCIRTNKIMEYRGSVIRETFAKYFATVGKNFANAIPDPKKSIESYIEKIIPCQNSMFMNPTHELEIKDLLTKLPAKTSSGFDAVSNKLLKDLTSSITHPLSIIFNKSLLEGLFPSRMKLAITVPLYKGKEKFLVNNYRPISLLLTISKVLEKIIVQKDLWSPRKEWPVV